MGHKKVCFSCRKAFSINSNNSKEVNLSCPECGKQMTLINHKFRPQKQNDIKRWKVAEFMKDNGFYYDHVYTQICYAVYLQIPYPDTMEEAISFVDKHKKI